MYDPEQELKTEQDLISDSLLLAKVAERCGEDHPWTQRVCLVTDILRTIAQKENDITNSFDDSKKEKIETEIAELIKLGKNALNNEKLLP